MTDYSRSLSLTICRQERTLLRSILILFCCAILFDGLANGKGKEDDWFIYLGNKSAPKAPRKSINAAEALPPLPLPATPLRRTERKKPPQPDYLIGKVIWGQSASFADSNGKQMKIADWNLCPTDLRRFVESARKLQLSYHWCNINLNDFHFDPAKLPSLFFSGVRTMRLDDAHIQSLREYVLQGGMIICDSIAGSPFFYDSAKQVFQQAFPESSYRTLPADHPLYHIFVDVEKVKKHPNDNDRPVLEGIYIGSRVGVLISPNGLGCGWNRSLARLKNLPDACYYDVKSAQQIGVNLAAYIVGYAEVGRVEGRPEVFGLVDSKRPSDEFIFAQLKHEGAWNVHPGGATSLLMRMRQHTSVRVNLNRIAVDAGRDDLSAFPFLYLTGLDDFVLSRQAVAALQRYLRYGGVLLINNGLGLSTFDKAVKRELGKVLPGAVLEPIPLHHGLYDCFFPINQVSYSPVVEKLQPELGGRPLLQGVNIEGDLRVIYSPFDLEAGWLGPYYPLIRGFRQDSARQLGMNIITYVMTH
jgi:Domain of unknown function (DUF4159)